MKQVIVKHHKVPGDCETCGWKLKGITYKGKYTYYICKPCAHKSYPLTKEYTREYNFKKKGVTSEWYDELFKNQNGVCAICMKPETSLRNGELKILSIDHDHRCCKWGCMKCTRGLLCFACNGALGKFGDDATTLKRAALYLESFNLNDLTVSE